MNNAKMAILMKSALVITVLYISTGCKNSNQYTQSKYSMECSDACAITTIDADLRQLISNARYRYKVLNSSSIPWECDICPVPDVDGGVELLCVPMEGGLYAVDSYYTLLCVFRLGAELGNIDPSQLISTTGNPEKKSLLILYFIEYENIVTRYQISKAARDILSDRNTSHPYVISASLQLLAKYATENDIGIIDKYINSDIKLVKDAAIYAKWKITGVSKKIGQDKNDSNEPEESEE